MPIFQDDLGGGRGTPPIKPAKSPPLNSPLDRDVITRKVSEESIRTELCEGPVPESPEKGRGTPSRKLDTNFTFPLHGTSDRVELIQRLKNGESPTWLPRNVRCILHSYFLLVLPELYTHCIQIVGVPSPRL
jgi:hypothetical protein